MSDVIPSSAGQLPSSQKLLRSTLIAAATALVLLVTVVMPAEYGVDPTGVGRFLGLTEMGKIKVQLAKEAAAAAVADASARTADAVVAPAPVQQQTQSAVARIIPDSVTTSAPPPKTDELSVTLRPNEGKEVKLAMREGARVSYSWKTDRGVVNYDTHADRKEAPAIKYHGYAKGKSKPSDGGVLIAAFDGMHGWFWRNRTDEVVTVTLRTTGDYREIRKMD